jgi:hypothetical protein
MRSTIKCTRSILFQVTSAGVISRQDENYAVLYFNSYIIRLILMKFRNYSCHKHPFVTFHPRHLCAGLIPSRLTDEPGPISRPKVLCHWAGQVAEGGWQYFPLIIPLSRDQKLITTITEIYSLEYPASYLLACLKLFFKNRVKGIISSFNT